MSELGVIRKFFARVNPFAMGDSIAEVLVKLDGAVDKVAAASAISRLKGVHCCFATNGSYSLYAGIAFRKIRELDASIAEIYSMYGSAVRGVEPLHAISIHPLRSSFLGAVNKDVFHKDGHSDGGKTDELSLKEGLVLKALRENARMPTVRIAERAGVSPETAAKIVKSFVKRRIVSRYTIEYDPKALGYARYICLFSTGTLDRKTSEELIRFVASHKSITYFINTSGSYSYVIDAHVRDRYELDDMMSQLEKILGERLTKHDILSVVGSNFGSSISERRSASVQGSAVGGVAHRVPDGEREADTLPYPVTA
jgi:DNA-binding Lrp family transcriptional regulator